MPLSDRLKFATGFAPTTIEEVYGSGDPIDFTFLSHTIVRFVGTLNPILELAALGRQELHDLIDATNPSTVEWSGGVVHILPDLKLMAVRVILALIF